MGKLPKIVLTMVAVTAIFLWMSTAFNSCGNKTDDLLQDSEDFMEESIEDTDAFIDDSEDDIFDGAEDEDFYIEEEDTEVEYVDDPNDLDFTTPEVISSTNTEEVKPASEPANAGSSYGDYMVIAGNYLVESNARLMTQKLNKLGYSNAEVAIFENSQYHTVVASRHDSYNSALNAEKAIKRQGVDCYVKRKKF